MKTNSFVKASWLIAATFFIASGATAQKTVKPKTAPKPIVFAVLDGGKQIEPIGAIDGGKLVDLGNADGLPTNFGTTYYKPKSTYPIIFGGAPDGALTITKSNVGTECGGATANVTSRPVKAKLNGLVMALATSGPPRKESTTFRRAPAPSEKAEIEILVRKEFKKNGAGDAAVKTLRFHNFTALDFDGDGTPEFVGSYWIAPTPTERRRLFFIAEGAPGGSIALTHSEHDVITPEDVMTNDLKDLDGGRGSELLLDVFDADGDGVKEIFTIGQAFEGNNYYVYKRTAGKWAKAFEVYRYRCAF
jgi:hypothetical protein